MSGQHDDAILPKKAIAVLCCIEDERNFCGYRVEQDGFYVVPLDADVLRLLSPEERAAAEIWHPTGQYDKPALPLPCTLGQLRAFAERAGLMECIDEESVADVVAELALNIGGSHRDTAKVGARGKAIENPSIPGKLPRVAIGRLAVTAAWQIECESRRAATAKMVIEQLQSWATEGAFPDILLRSEPKKRAVIWMTTKTGKEKEYDVGACGKALDEWRKSRAQGESRDARQRVGMLGV